MPIRSKRSKGIKTSKSKKELFDDLEKYREQVQQRSENTKKCTEEVLAVFKKYMPDPREKHGSKKNLPLTPEKVLADAIRYFAVGGIVELYVDWTILAYYEQEVKEMLSWAEKIYKILIKYSFSRDNPFRYNDLDNKAFWIDTPSKEDETQQIFCLEDQNTRFLFMIVENCISKRFRCCQYWDIFDPEHSSFDHEELEGVELALQSADWIHHNYSDCTAENPEGGSYRPMRPSLNWFAKRQFDEDYKSDRNIGYGDCRDSQHVFNIETKEDGVSTHDDQIVYRVHKIGMALFSINSCLTCLEEDEKRGRLK